MEIGIYIMVFILSLLMIIGLGAAWVELKKDFRSKSKHKKNTSGKLTRELLDQFAQAAESRIHAMEENQKQMESRYESMQIRYKHLELVNTNLMKELFSASLLKDSLKSTQKGASIKDRASLIVAAAYGSNLWNLTGHSIDSLDDLDLKNHMLKVTNPYDAYRNDPQYHLE